MIFRKVSDVKKERELAERRKDDPALNQTQGDHNLKSITKLIKKASQFYILKICFCLCKMS